MKVKILKDVMGGRKQAEILCAIKGNVVRTLTVKDGMVHIACPNGDAVDMPEMTPVAYDPWFLDRGNLILNGNLKLATEMDIVRYSDGVEDRLMPSIDDPVPMDDVEPPEETDDGGCDPLYGQRMDSADMLEN